MGSLPSSVTDKPHFLQDCIMESFIFPTSDHASPTHFVKRTLHWLPLILPSLTSTYLFIQVIFKQRTYFIFKRFIYRYGHKMYILVVHWLEQFCVSLKALSRYRFIARDEHQQLEFFPSEFWPIGFLKGSVHSVETHSSIISWSRQPFS